ncbi:hypothetical protein [Halorarum salinum]|uniref:Uncharacterized protein n=1 Tax=Halorarum salinum TaxID=2743089 RepID=A0A7D5LCE8_9EURY|nr:hypothetical protein [Halobaculum salinum]QLG63208.1 hypothetical protein HUG12_16295 [Halobaculum salinum]
MTESLSCGVCGRSVPLDEDHVTVSVEAIRIRDRDNRDEYVLHWRCAESAFGGWLKP